MGNAHFAELSFFKLSAIWLLILLGPLAILCGLFVFPSRILSEPYTWIALLQWLFVGLLLAAGIAAPCRSKISPRKARILSIVCTVLWFVFGFATILSGLT